MVNQKILLLQHLCNIILYGLLDVSTV